MLARMVTLVLLLSFTLSSAIEICEKGLRTRVQNGTVGQDGGLLAEDGTLYPNDTFWQEDDFWWACPCLSGPCVRICAITTEYIKEIEMRFEIVFTNSTILEVDAGKIETKFWEDKENLSKNMTLKNTFKLVQLENGTELCPSPELIQELKYDGDIKLFKDGSLLHFHINNEESIIGPDQYCIYPFEWHKFNLAVLICDTPYPKIVLDRLTLNSTKIDVFFLVLTLIVHYLFNKDLKRLHVKLLINHCVCLMCSDLSFIFFVEIDALENYAVCYIYVLFLHYFDMAYYFWLNAMCYEMYSTLKCGYGRHNLKMKYFELYAWGTPLVFTLFVVLMQHILPKDHILRPELEFENLCVLFEGELQHFIYNEDPKMVMVVSNIVLFVMTAMVLRRSRRESNAALSTGDSNIHQAESDKNSPKSRLSMFLKLFLLMGCNWILEILSWYIDEPRYIWRFINCFNYLRGVFIFWIFVISDRDIRKVVLENISKVMMCKK